MGQRGAQAAFMASKFVFPGGAVDQADSSLKKRRHLSKQVAAQLAFESPVVHPVALAHAAIRELWEETGLALAHKEKTNEAVPADWERFFAAGYVPAIDRLQPVFRAVTPLGRPRRFDARFFVASAADLQGDPDDFSAASGELSSLQWVPLEDARSLPLPFITELVLAEVEAMSVDGPLPRPIPFFRQGADGPSFCAIPIEDA